MKKLLGNSCSRGCLVYVIALLLIIVLTSVGLGGLKGRFLPNTQASNSPITVMTTSKGTAPSSGGHASGQVVTDGGATATTVPVMPPLPPAPTAAAAQSSSDTSQSRTPSQAQAQTSPQTQAPPQAQAQGGLITGDASAPFYIVQGGDTLWGISQQFSTSVDALKGANTSLSDIIRPGQLIYLAPTNSSTGSAGQSPDASASGQSSSGSVDNIPSMPHTGINSQP